MTLPDYDTVRVGLDNRSYDVVIGASLLEHAGDLIAPFLKRPRLMIITDQHVDDRQGSRLHAGLEKANIIADKIVLPPGEGTKSFEQLGRLLDAMLQRGIERDDLIVAFGGGVIGDLVGLAAGLLRRGCRFVQIPTSLLAQVDSSVGGKTAVNNAAGKNLIGLFHQPTHVIADIACLTTLPHRELLAGYAEVVKYGALGDAAFFDWLEKNMVPFMDGDMKTRAAAVAKCVSTKASIVARDEHERGERALLNLGHTFGHAIEAIYGFDGRLLHGEAVAAGMGLAFDYSAAQGDCEINEAERLKQHLRQAGLPTGFHDLPDGPAIRRDDMLAAMAQDKKVAQGALTLILTRRIGDAYVARNVDTDKLSHFLDKAITGQRHDVTV